MAHPLGELIRAAAEGRFPPPDGGVTVVAPFRDGVETVMAFTGHAVVATTAPAKSVLAEAPDGFGGAVTPRFLLWLAGADGSIGSHDVVLVGIGNGHSSLVRRRDLDHHPRVKHARTIRDDVEVYGNERGLVTIGVGIGGVPELSVEVAQDVRSRGRGRTLIAEALGLIPEGEVVAAEVAPGNAQSLRAFLAAGFKSVGSAVHVTRQT